MNNIKTRNWLINLIGNRFTVITIYQYIVYCFYQIFSLFVIIIVVIPSHTQRYGHRICDKAATAVPNFNVITSYFVLWSDDSDSSGRFQLFTMFFFFKLLSFLLICDIKTSYSKIIKTLVVKITICITFYEL